MLGQRSKIVNDPVYGFISIPLSVLFDLVEHPYFQRLRRIKQLGLTHYVYPGALHTRFHHALGAVHLMGEAIDVLRSKGTDITDVEAEAVLIAILLHDIGHGPFSHALEHKLVPVHHETLSLLFMQELNRQFDGKLDLAIRIFQNQYEKRYLHQLISGQLDMDRMDYLKRDSFFTGVHEGVIGYHRLIKMLAVKDGELVIEEKGLYSVEKFLVARRLMYWQAYLHKTVLSAEQMLIRVLDRAKWVAKSGFDLKLSGPLEFFLCHEYPAGYFKGREAELLHQFAQLDDYDIIAAIKSFVGNPDVVLSELANGLINRRLLKIKMKNNAFSSDLIDELRLKVGITYGVNAEEASYLVFAGSESISNYSIQKDEIKVLFKSGKVLPMSECADLGIVPKEVVKHYLCFPKKVAEIVDQWEAKR